MNEQLETLGEVMKLGLGGVLLIVAAVIFRAAQKWMNDQQARDDKRLAEQQARDDKRLTEQNVAQEKLITIVMSHQTEQMGVIRETARFLHEAAADLRVVTDRISERRGG